MSAPAPAPWQAPAARTSLLHAADTAGRHSDESGYVWTDVGSDLSMNCVKGKAIRTVPPEYGGLSLGAPGAPGLAELYELVGPNGNVIVTRDVCKGAATPAVARAAACPDAG